jgi:hypothetical protein
MDIQTIVIVIAVVLLVAFSLFQSSRKKQQKESMTATLVAIDGFTPSQEWMGEDGKTGIAIDEKSKQVGLIRHGNDDVVTGVFAYTDILAAEILEDGKTLAKTSRSSRKGKAKTSELGLAGDSQAKAPGWDAALSDEPIRTLDLRVTVDSATHPVHEVSFMNMESKKQSVTYTRALKNAKHWHALLESVMSQADRKDSTDS